MFDKKKIEKVEKFYRRERKRFAKVHGDFLGQMLALIEIPKHFNFSTEESTYLMKELRNYEG